MRDLRNNPATRKLMWLLLAGAFAGAHGQAAPADPNKIRAEISAQIDKMAAATRAKNIDSYMECVPPDFLLKQDDGSTIGRDGLRAHVLEMWSVIPETKSLTVQIDRIEPAGPGEATAWTSQRWDRTMMSRDGKSRHDVLSTEKHRERWKVLKGQWFSYDVQELSGNIWIDGKPYVDPSK